MRPSPWISSRFLEFGPDSRNVQPFDPAFPLILSRFEFSCSHRVAPNYHDYFEIGYIYKGKCELFAGRKKTDLAPGDLFIIGSDQMHTIYAKAGERPRIITAFFMPQIICRLGSNAPAAGLLRPFYDRSAGFSHRIPASATISRPAYFLLLNLESALGSSDPFRELECTHLLWRLLLLICRRYGRPKAQTGDTGAVRRSGGIDRLKNVFLYLNQHYHENISLRQLASVACFSPAYFCSYFRNIAGLTPKEYITRLRIDKAQELLIKGSMTITGIALETGFESLAYFDRVFRHYTGLSPQEYCRRLKDSRP